MNSSLNYVKTADSGGGILAILSAFARLGFSRR
jgi:hypothetical protein